MWLHSSISQHRQSQVCWTCNGRQHVWRMFEDQCTGRFISRNQCEKCMCYMYAKCSDISVKKAKCHSFYWHINYVRNNLDDPLASIKGINPSSLSPCDSAFALSTENSKLRGNNVEMRTSTKPWHVNTIRTRVEFARIIKSTQLVWRRPATKKQLQGLEAWTGVVEEGIKDENGTYSELIYGVDAIFEAENWMCSPEVIHSFHKNVSKSWVAVQIWALEFNINIGNFKYILNIFKPLSYSLLESSLWKFNIQVIG